MYVDLLEYIDSLERTLGPDSLQYQATLQAYDDHPNLRAWKDHLGVVRLCTVDVNLYCDTLDMTHRTDQGSLEVLPFIQDNGLRIYSDPPIYVVGYRNQNGFGEKPLADWDVLLRDAGIGDDVILKVRNYLLAHQPVNYSEIPD